LLFFLCLQAYFYHLEKIERLTQLIKEMIEPWNLKEAGRKDEWVNWTISIVMLLLAAETWKLLVKAGISYTTGLFTLCRDSVSLFAGRKSRIQGIRT
jgi:hypothetical protein